MKVMRWRLSSRHRMPFGCEPLEARLQFAGDLTFDASFSPDLQSALDHAIIAKGNTTAHLESSGLGLVLELTGNADTLLSVAADGIPASIAGLKVLDASQFSISGARGFAFLNLNSVAQARITGIQVQYSLYADNVGELQTDAHHLPVTVAGSGSTVFYSTSFDGATVLSSAANLTLAAPTGVNALSLVLLESSARVHLAFSTGDLTIYGGVSAQVDQTSFRHGYAPHPFAVLTAPPPEPVPPPVAVIPPAPILTTTHDDAGILPSPAGDTGDTPTPVTVSDPVVSTPPAVVLLQTPVVTAPQPVEFIPPPVVVAPPPVAGAPPMEMIPPPVVVSPPPVAVTTPPPVIEAIPPSPPVVSNATGAAAVPEFLRALVYLANLNLISFDDQTRTHLSFLLGRADAADMNDAVTIKTHLSALDFLDHHHETEWLSHDGPANRKPALAGVPSPLPPLTLTSHATERRQPDFASLPAAAGSSGHVAGDTVLPVERAIHFLVPPPSGAENAGPWPRLFTGETPTAASFAVATVSLPAAPLQALGHLLADHLQAEFTPGERAAVLISEARLAGFSLHG